jgi:hypothetical protein
VPVLANSQFALAEVNGILISFILPIIIGYSVQIWNRIKAT